MDPLEVYLPVAFTDPSIKRAPEDNSQNERFSGIVSLSPHSEICESSSELKLIVPLREPRPSNSPSPTRV